MQADRAAQELPSLVAPISRGLNAAVERLAVVEHTCLSLADAVQASDLEKALARWGSQPVLLHVSPALHSIGPSASHVAQRKVDANSVAHPLSRRAIFLTHHDITPTWCC